MKLENKISRREFCRFIGGVAIAGTASLSAFNALANENYNIDNLVEKEPFEWTDIKCYEYWGKLTYRQVHERKVKEGFYSNVKKEDIEALLSGADNSTKLDFFVSEENIKGYDIPEPTTVELKQYHAFVAQLNVDKKRGLEKIKFVYEKFQKKTGGTAFYNHENGGVGFLGEQPLHPASIIAGKKAGVCFDKAFALYDIYSRLGFKCKICTGETVPKSKIYHAWVRVYLDNAEIDLDPTIYDNFKILRREDRQVK